MTGKLVDLLLRALLLAATWIVVSEGRVAFWYYGIGTVAAAVAVSVWVRPLRAPGRLRARAWLLLMVWAAGRAVAGAVDVARRALGPSRLVDPVEEDVEVRVPMDRGGLIAVALSNLMPGTLVHRIGDDTVGMHALAADLDAPDGWRALQQRLGRVMPGSTGPGSAPAHRE